MGPPPDNGAGPPDNRGAVLQATWEHKFRRPGLAILTPWQAAR